MRQRLHRGTKRLLRAVARAVGTIPHALKDCWLALTQSVCGWSGSSTRSRAYRSSTSSNSERMQGDEWLRSEAERVLAGERMVFGCQFTVDGDKDWQRDPLSGRVWRRLPHAWIDVNRSRRSSEVRAVWELNRLQHLVPSALAFWRFAEEKYAVFVLDEILGWSRANPVNMGVNWTCAMEVAIRAVNMLEARRLCSAAASWDSDAAVAKILEQHLDYIKEHLEDWGAWSQNHLVGDLVGVLAVAAELPGRAETAAWAAEEIERCIRQQVFEDGVSFENSTGYHMLATELFGYAALTMSRCGIGLGTQYRGRLEAMLRFLADIRLSDGSLPDFGDNDSGRLLRPHGYFDQRVRDCDYVQALASEGLCAMGDARAGDVLSRVAGLGAGGTQNGNMSAADLARHRRGFGYVDGGVYGLRVDGLAIVVNAARTGVGGRGPHRHNDALSFVAECSDRPVIIDSGTYCYQRSPARRRAFRSVKAHNTVAVDDQEQNDLSALFALSEDLLDVEVLEWSLSSDGARLVARHHAYEALADPVQHTREYVADARRELIRITDFLAAASQHAYEARFILHPACEVQDVQHVGGEWVVGLDECRIGLRVTPAESARVDVVEASVSLRFQHIERTRAIIVRWSANGDCSLVANVSALGARE